MTLASPYRFEVPEDQKNHSVKLWNQSIILPTYEVGEADKNPMFFEKRVYQGSNGKVYPLPYTDKVDDVKRDKEYDGVFLENDFVRFLILPELGGRIQIGQDKCNNDYDFFYRNDVIKPALVGLAGPWLSGGVEFNWPQHHRPATYMPVEYLFEEEEDGSKTLWLSDHDPMERMKGMIGLCLKPDSSVLEAKVRLYNRTDQTKTFLWWANVASEVHNEYQSFFPPDVNYVADHAARAMTEFPLSKGKYYGIDYAPGTDISRYSNIPVPTSYMVVETDGEFFGGYDYKAEGGFIHVANKHISPGKKQWTWGNAEFGWAWDKNLTDNNGPYVELMAGVHTNNQPDFTYLLPGETKTFTQIWYPIKRMGRAHEANRYGAIHLSVKESSLRMAANVTSPHEDTVISLSKGDEVLMEEKITLNPGNYYVKELPFKGDTEGLTLKLRTADGKILVQYTQRRPQPVEQLPDAASETPAPKELDSTEELYLAGEHLKQYRHPTRYSEDYWTEALRRDPADIRCNTALGQLHRERFNYTEAEKHFRKAIERLTVKHPNPVDGESFYGLGQTLKRQGRNQEAYAAFYKSTWNFAWRASAYLEIGMLDLLAGHLEEALKYLDTAIRHNWDNFKAHMAKSIALRYLGRTEEAIFICRDILKADKLFFMARQELVFNLQSLGRTDEAKTEESFLISLMKNREIPYVDMACDYLSLGSFDESMSVLEILELECSGSHSPFIHYLKAWIDEMRGRDCSEHLAKAAAHSPDYFFPSTEWEHDILLWAMEKNDGDSNAPYYLGNLLYDKKRKEEAVICWEKAAERGSNLSIVFRNLGIAYYNFTGESDKALATYEKAFALAPHDGRLLFELDQLKKKMNVSPSLRLAFLSEHHNHITKRDDLAIEMANLKNLTGSPETALEILSSRSFHPWEGGEGQVINAWANAHIILGQRALREGRAKEALEHFDAILNIPGNLGEVWHPLQNQAHVHYHRGLCLKNLGQKEQAAKAFTLSSESEGDFMDMAVQEVSEISYYTAKSMEELGHKDESVELYEKMIACGERMLKQEASIDYFATSLPLLLVFDDDLRLRTDIQAKYLMALGNDGIGNRKKYNELRAEILKADITHSISLTFVKE